VGLTVLSRPDFAPSADLALARLFRTLIGVNSVRGRRLQPVEVFEVTPWRALALFRLITLAYAVVLTAINVGDFPHQWAAWLVSGVMVVWSGLATIGYERPRLRSWPLLIGDLDITAGCLLSTLPVIGPHLLARGVPTLTVTWMACPVLAVAIVKGIRWGVVMAILMGACDLTVHGVTLITQTALTGTVIMVMAATALGYLANIGVRAQEQLRLMAAGEAVHAERERLARTIHDSVLQVLALVKRRGEELGGEAAELGRLAGEQELALRTLIGSVGDAPAPTGMVDLREMVGSLATSRVTVSAPATGMWLPAQTAREIFAAVGAASENAHQHCPPQTRVWILLEDEMGTVTATIRDDGPGIPAGRLDQAAAQGRLGVAKSIRGRIADLGGRVVITSTPGEGTEVELTVRRKGYA
jgi:signal transduction histidine kinase